MGDESALRAAIDADPADVLTRLVFADFLDDHGRNIEAELVRLLCGEEIRGVSVRNWFRHRLGWPKPPSQRGWLQYASTHMDWPEGQEAVRRALQEGTVPPSPATVFLVAWAWLDLPPLPAHRPPTVRPPAPPPLPGDRAAFVRNLPMPPSRARARLALWNGLHVPLLLAFAVLLAMAGWQLATAGRVADHTRTGLFFGTIAAVIGVVRGWFNPYEWLFWDEESE